MLNKIVSISSGGGFDAVKLITQELNIELSDNEMLVRINASSLNYHDYAVVSGMWGPSEDRIPMSDGAGEVIQVGKNVSEFKVGDKVVSTFFPDWENGPVKHSDFSTTPGDGVDGYAREFVVATSSHFTHAPEGWSSIESATLTTAALTAWRALFEDVKLTKDDTVLVQGTGGVSIFALQFAKMIGAKVIATSSNDQKIERLKELGADHCINYKKSPNWGELALQFTNGKGVDYVIDVGGPDTINQSLIASKLNGHIAFIGILSGLEGKLDMIHLLLKQIKIQGVLVGNRQQQINMINAINQYKMKPVVDRIFKLEQIVDAFKYQESNQHFGKICLEI